MNTSLDSNMLFCLSEQAIQNFEEDWEEFEAALYGDGVAQRSIETEQPSTESATDSLETLPESFAAPLLMIQDEFTQITEEDTQVNTYGFARSIQASQDLQHLQSEEYSSQDELQQPEHGRQVLYRHPDLTDEESDPYPWVQQSIEEEVHQSVEEEILQSVEEEVQQSIEGEILQSVEEDEPAVSEEVHIKSEPLSDDEGVEDAGIDWEDVMDPFAIQEQSIKVEKEEDDDIHRTRCRHMTESIEPLPKPPTHHRESKRSTAIFDSVVEGLLAAIIEVEEEARFDSFARDLIIQCQEIQADMPYDTRDMREALRSIEQSLDMTPFGKADQGAQYQLDESGRCSGVKIERLKHTVAPLIDELPRRKPGRKKYSALYDVLHRMKNYTRDVVYREVNEVGPIR